MPTTGVRRAGRPRKDPTKTALERRREQRRANSKAMQELEKYYPEREGYGRALHRRNNPLATDEIPIYHVGYTSEKMIPCVCGAQPVLEQWVGDQEDTHKHAPAQVFVAICPICEMRGAGHGSLKACVQNWNKRRFTRSSLMMRRKPKDMDEDACRRLCRAVIGDAVQEALWYIRRNHEVQAKIDVANDYQRELYEKEQKEVRSKLNEIQRFIERSPLLFDLDSEAVLSGIRRTLYPDKTPEERVKIPLTLAKM